MINEKLVERGIRIVMEMKSVTRTEIIRLLKKMEDVLKEE